MKTYTSIFMALFMAFTLAAAPKCERLEFYDFGNLKASFETDLLSNVWKTSILGMPATLYFQDEGLVMAVPVNAGRVETYTWSLAVDAGTALLSFYNSTGDRHFTIAPTCSGLSVSARGKTNTMLVSNTPRISGSELDFLNSQLPGIWHYRARESGKKSYPARFSLAMAKDGTFKLLTGPDRYHSMYEGVWQISPDGQYLVLHTKVLIGGKEHFVPEAISLKSVDYEDMVIEARTLPRALEAYSGKEPLYLSKARA